VPAQKGIPGNEVADGWAKQAASEPDDHGVEWLAYANGVRRPLPPNSLVHLKRKASEKKWPEARLWCERRQLNRCYVLRKKGKPDPAPARAEKRTAARFYQLMSGHALMGVYLESTQNRPDDHCWRCDPEYNSGTRQMRDHPFNHCYKWKEQAVMWASGFSCVFFLSFQNVYSPWCGLLLFPHDLSPWCSHSALNLSAVCCNRARPSGRDGRQGLENCRHSLYRLNASMIEQKKKRTSIHVGTGY